MGTRDGEWWHWSVYAFGSSAAMGRSPAAPMSCRDFTSSCATVTDLAADALVDPGGGRTSITAASGRKRGGGVQTN